VSNEDASSEDLTILAAVESLERGTAPFRAPRGDEAAETLARLYTEALGLLPYGLEPVAPAPEIRKRLMALVQGDETQPAAAPTGPAAAAPPRSSQEVRPPRLASAVPPFAAARRPPPRRWPLALAATLCIGLVGLSLWLSLQLGQQRQTIARLEKELVDERTRAEESVAQALRLQASELDLREKFALVTSPAVLVSPMRPAGSPPLQPGAGGVLFVASDHQHWYLSLKGMEPAAAGKVYKLWFVADAGKVSGGSFTARPGEPIELSSKTMPAGTREAVITLEDDARTLIPAGPEILRSSPPVEIG